MVVLASLCRCAASICKHFVAGLRRRGNKTRASLEMCCSITQSAGASPLPLLLTKTCARSSRAFLVATTTMGHIQLGWQWSRPSKRHKDGVRGRVDCPSLRHGACTHMAKRSRDGGLDSSSPHQRSAEQRIEADRWRGGVCSYRDFTPHFGAAANGRQVASSLVVWTVAAWKRGRGRSCVGVAPSVSVAKEDGREPVAAGDGEGREVRLKDEG